MKSYSLSLLSALGLGALLPLSALAEDQFSVTMGDTVVLDHTMKRAKVRWATEDSWHFASSKVAVRVEPFRIGDDPVASTEEFVARNTGFSWETTIDGAKRRVGCDPEEDQGVSINRTELTDTRVSGNFRMTLVRCDDFYTAEPVELDSLPFTIEGTFSVAIKR